MGAGDHYEGNEMTAIGQRIASTAARAAEAAPERTAAEIAGDLVGSKIARAGDTWNSDIAIGARRVVEGPPNGYSSLEDALAAIRQHPPADAREPRGGSVVWEYPIATVDTGRGFVNVLGDNAHPFSYYRSVDERVAALSSPDGYVFTSRGSDGLAAQFSDRLEVVSNSFWSGTVL